MRSTPRFRTLLLMASALVAAAACSSSSGTSNSVATTLVTISPATFAGNVTCAALPGAWRTYVARLIDVTDPSRPFPLAYSGPVSCNLPVSFAIVEPDHYYIAEVQGYDRADIAPWGGASSGSPHMIDPSGQDVAPRWVTTCGAIPTPVDLADAGADADIDAEISSAFSASSTLCWQSANVLVQHCLPLQDQQPGGASTITLRLASLRGALTCGADAGQIARLRVVPADPALHERGAACDEAVTFSDLTPGTDYSFRVEAFEEPGGAATWAASCHATAKAGIDMPAQCELLSDKGSFVIDFAALLSQASHQCAADDVTGYRAVLLGSNQVGKELSCSADTTFNGLSPATYQVVVDAFDSSHTVAFSAFCEAAVQAGVTSTATCAQSPAR